MIQISLPDGSTLEQPRGVTILEVASSIGPRLAEATVCAVVNGTLRDVRETLAEDCALTLVTTGEPQALETLRHTTTHIMAQAAKRLFPGAKLGIGPAIEDGFYYDFDLPASFTEDDLERITAEMVRIIEEDLPIERSELSKAEARELLAARGETYKLDRSPARTGAATSCDRCSNGSTGPSGRRRPTSRRTSSGWRRSRHATTVG